MAASHEDEVPGEFPDVATRQDARGNWTSAVPLALLALLTLMLLHACVPR